MGARPRRCTIDDEPGFWEQLGYHDHGDPGASSATGATDAPPCARIALARAAGASRREETPRARTLVLDVPDWPGHRAGQHVDVRLTAEDGYQAQRSYSIATPPEDERIELTIERLTTARCRRTWARSCARATSSSCAARSAATSCGRRDGGPLLLVAGGSGIVPLMAMLRHRAAQGARRPRALILSARTRSDVFYRDELRGSARPIRRSTCSSR